MTCPNGTCNKGSTLTDLQLVSCAPGLAFEAFRVPKMRALTIEPAEPDRAWMSSGNAEFANRCLPLRIANQCGWSLASPMGFQVAWDGSNRVKSLHLIQQDEPGPLPIVSHFGFGILTWLVPFVFRLPSGWSLRVRGPINEPKDAISPLEGVVEADWSVATFTMNWKFTRPSTIEFKKGEVFCVLVPERRADLERFVPVIRELESDPQLRDAHRAWATSRHSALKERKPEDWEKHYFKGTHPSAKPNWKAPNHKTHLELAPFADETRSVGGDASGPDSDRVNASE